MTCLVHSMRALFRTFKFERTSRTFPKKSTHEPSMVSLMLILGHAHIWAHGPWINRAKVSCPATVEQHSFPHYFFVTTQKHSKLVNCQINTQITGFFDCPLYPPLHRSYVNEDFAASMKKGQNARGTPTTYWERSGNFYWRDTVFMVSGDWLSATWTLNMFKVHIARTWSERDAG